MLKYTYHKERKCFMKLIDLHVHSTASDGSLTPSQVVERAFQKKLTAIALTDHDTTSGIDEALSAASSLPLELIPGIELSCLYKEKEIHILGLYLDHHDPALVKFLSEARKKREQRNLLILDAFQKDGFAITWEDLIGHHPDTAVTRAHFARALLKKGYVSSVDQAFRKYLNPECPYYRPRKMISPEESLNAIHAAGGFSVLAHPCLYRLGWEETETLIAYLKELGMNGLECWHSSNTAEESRKLQKLAKSYHLLPTGGSDFHGAAKPDIELGCGRGSLRVSALYLDDIKQAMGLLPSASDGIL